ncbi:MAG TPA: hypothetical protein VGJ44_04105 [Kribbellaceae bacterium]
MAARKTTGTKAQGYVLEVPLDASAVGKGEAQELRVIAVRKEGTAAAATATVRPGGAQSVALSFDAHPGAVRVLVGPGNATDEELIGSQTIAVDVPSRVWDGPKAVIDPVRISPYYWHWWPFWCREFVVRGRVVCADGSPVPGAEVCGYDVDWLWWWSSSQLVGCDTTDVNGAFEIKFRWCCGRWPWWWWKYREWRFDPILAERITPVLERDPRIELGRTTAQPSLEPLSKILASDGIRTDRPLTASDAAQLDAIRGKLTAVLPPAPELEALRVWPWVPWWPWWDCTPDLIFRVTQDCEKPGTVIYSESVLQTRWNIANPLDVTLVANDLACCRRVCPDQPCVEGECIDISNICGASIDDVGGNPGAAATPEGYLYPNAVAAGTAAWNGDRPFAGTVTVSKANIMTGVDYYEIEVDSGGGYGPMPPGAAVSFSRHWLRPPGPWSPVWTHGDVGFAFTSMSGHTVVGSREHWEATTGLPAAAFWTTNADLVVPIDSTKFGDGTYRFRVVGWRDGGGGTLTDPRVLPVCETEIPNGWVLTFDNRLEPDPAHPTSPTHPCGPGTVHACVTEPDTDIIAVRVNGVAVDPCEVVSDRTGMLEIDFMAHDPDGHLALYELKATYAENAEVQLLPLHTLPGASLTLLSGDYVGPTYGEALGQGAPQPTWRGGTMRLVVPAADAFPRPCCYQLELRAWKRTVVSCSGEAAHHNLSEYTIGVGVCGPVAGPADTPVEVAHPGVVGARG